MPQPSKYIYRIPVFTNSAIIACCTGLYFFLMWKASHLSNPWWLIPIAIAFAIIMIPVYSLIHEAEHGILYADKKINYLGGVHLCNLFIAPFTFFRHCHLNHHKHNRTDLEMWDLYYEHQNLFLRYGNLYLMMIGFGYVMLPISVILSAIYPPLLFSKIFTSHTEMNGFLEGVDKPSKLFKIQKESIIVVIFQIALFFVLHLKLFPYILLLVAHGFLWSSQNYVNHAFAPRDIINGAHNHKMALWLKYVYLNFNVHLAHHQNPLIPWIHLSKFIKQGPERISFLKAYFRLWKGPKLTREHSPDRIRENKIN